MDGWLIIECPNTEREEKKVGIYRFIKVYSCTGPIIITNGAYTAPVK